MIPTCSQNMKWDSVSAHAHRRDSPLSLCEAILILDDPLIPSCVRT